jgi:hypothetical protein
MTSRIAQRYAAAAAVAPDPQLALMKNRTISPHWLDTERFWYQRDREEGGTEFVQYDIALRSGQPLFDHEALARDLTAVTGWPVSPNNLPIVNYQRMEGGRIEVALIDGRGVELADGAEARIVTRSVDTLPHADGKAELFVKDHNLWLRDTVDGSETALTEDGEAHFAWATMPDQTMVHIPSKKFGWTFPPAMTGFSPSGRYVVTARRDERGFREWPFVEYLPAGGTRPQLHGIRCLLDDEEDSGSVEFAIIDTTTRHGPDEELHHRRTACHQ